MKGGKILIVEYIDEEKMRKLRHEIFSVLADNDLTFQGAKYCLNEMVEEITYIQDSIKLSSFLEGGESM